MSLHIIILAAGAGKRMFSQLPKVLHPIGGEPMLSRIVRTAQTLNPEQIHLVYGHSGEAIQKALPNLPVHWVKQAVQSGTGHACWQALPYIPDDADVLVLSGDVPLIKSTTLEALMDDKDKASLRLLIATVRNPYGLGRIVREQIGEGRQQGNIIAIVEERDATAEQKKIKEIYSGICCVNAKKLKAWLPQLKSHNAQEEYYLTDIIQMAVEEHYPIDALCAENTNEIKGINDRSQLAYMERVLQQQGAQDLLLAGVSLADPARIDIRGTLICGQDVFIDVNCVFTGEVVIGDDCIIGPHCCLSNVTIGKGTHILANSVITESRIGENCSIGPFAHLRPGTTLGNACKIGNFVETKQIDMGSHSKASHLTYLGDAIIGEYTNIGAGVITCNYDGANKYKTVIGDHVFVGSGCQLIAPTELGDYATVGAGTTLRTPAPAHALTLTERHQKTIAKWKRPEKKVKA